MLIKAGVDISRLNPQIRRALKPLAKLWVYEATELVVTSTYEGNHMPSSLHYHNDAVDLRWPVFRDEQKPFLEKIKKLLGDDFNVMAEGPHIHVEYDPKGRA